MGLTPDEIAHRSFTPSADGYHQGEVRSFLERIAAQLSAMQSTLPEGSLALGEFTTAIQDREPRLVQLQEQLHETLAELTAVASLMREAQTEAADQIATAQQIVSGQSSAATSTPGQSGNEQAMTAQLAIVQKITADQREASEYLATAGQQQSDQIDAARKLAANQREAAEHLAIAGQQQAAQLEAAQELTARQTKAADQLTSATELAAQRLAEVTGAAAAIAATPIAAAPTTPGPRATPPVSGITPRASSDPTDAPSTPSSGSQPSPVPSPTKPDAPDAVAENTMSLFASDLDDQPLFSDSANDLLDGVLDDVMGNLEGDES